MTLAACAKGAIANSAQSINLLMEFTDCQAGSEHSRPFIVGAKAMRELVKRSIVGLSFVDEMIQ